MAHRLKNLVKCALGMGTAFRLGRVGLSALPALLTRSFFVAPPGGPLEPRLLTIAPPRQVLELPSDWGTEIVLDAFEGQAWSFAGQEGRIDNFFEFLAATRTGAFLVLQGGRLRFEWYAPGLRPMQSFRLFSISKTLVSTLVAIAVAERRLALQDTAEQVLRHPERTHVRGITVEQLLRMRLPVTAFGKLGRFADWATETYPHDIRALSRARLAEMQGSGPARFLYGETPCWLLAQMLEAAYQRPFTELVAEKLWRPLGMEYGSQWLADRNGAVSAGIGCQAAARDLLRLGRFYLAAGVAAGRPLLPQGWLKDAWAPGADEPPGYYDAVLDWPQVKGVAAPFYGYLWWGAGRPDGPPDLYASGRSGQLLYLSPGNDLAIVRLGAQESWFDGWVPLLYGAAERLVPARVQA